MKIIGPTEHSFLISDEISNGLIKDFAFNGEKQHLKTYIAPLISNEIYKRDQKLIEYEKFKTLIKLSKTFDEENMFQIIKTLDLKLEFKQDYLR